MRRIDAYFERGETYLAEYPGAEFPYWGTICMLGTATLPSWLLAGVSTIIALIVGHPCNWIAGAFIFVAVFFSFAAVIVWKEDRAILGKRGWFASRHE